MQFKKSSEREQHISDLWSCFFPEHEMTPIPELPVAENPHTMEEENKEHTPEKTGNNYKDVKECKFSKLMAVHMQKMIRPI